MTPRQAREQADDDLRTLARTPAGLRFFRRLLTQAGLVSSVLPGDGAEFLNGRRSVAVALFEELQRVVPECVPRLFEADAVEPEPDDE